MASRRSFLALAAVVSGGLVAGCSSDPAPAGTEIESLRIPTSVGTFDALAAGPTDGRKVLLLHGFPESATEWTHQLTALGQLGYRAVAVDQRGYSPDVRPTAVGEYAFDLLADDVARIADALDWPRFDLVGHDFGAAVSWIVAARYRDRVRTLSAFSVPHLGAFGRGLREDPEQQRASTYMAMLREPEQAERRLLADDARMMREVYEGVPRAHVDEYVRRLSEPGALTAALNWYRANDFQGYDQKIEVPTLYVWGSGDGAVAASTVRGTAEWVTGPYRFEELPEVGHFAPEAQPDRTTALLHAHFQAN
ncbi:alpha/beta fold hydrolase [Nocardia sp. NPDC050406]|uniref:alpha/beta fold hydrolase n=1 Tax=Nocardia sp. NPDC050406 TaxID=3364318 RepID=UPI0037AF4EAA